ncbi:hypothetical protein RHGRI_022477 [Rhododendron griersonianum]|uniref:Uncharacterized protein n=1 Tax=Rhododendron griersonianum TaxID=479676 RepID=A0AAV6J5A9_9ERIC|nr:hypothetical protein RHGRI_022477 [Rhododendron griersonianum]
MASSSLVQLLKGRTLAANNRRGHCSRITAPIGGRGEISSSDSRFIESVSNAYEEGKVPAHSAIPKCGLPEKLSQ